MKNFIARGAFGEVWRAERIAAQGKDVAIKLFSTTEREEHQQRSKNEIQVLLNLHHPNVVDVQERLELADRGIEGMVMELVDGEPLDQWTARNIDRRSDQRLPLELVARVLEQICAGVGAAHARSLVHRDLKPENVLVVESTGGCHVKVIDFSIVRDLARPVTATKIGMGTPQYMAPEQSESQRDVTPRSDVFAIAAITVEMLRGKHETGVPESSRWSFVNVYLREKGEIARFISAARPDIPFDLCLLLETSLSLNPGDRPDDAQDFWKRFQRCVSEHDVEGPRPSQGAPGVLEPWRQPVSDHSDRERSFYRVWFAVVVILLLAITAEALAH